MHGPRRSRAGGSGPGVGRGRPGTGVRGLGSGGPEPGPRGLGSRFWVRDGLGPAVGSGHGGNKAGFEERGQRKGTSTRAPSPQGCLAAGTRRVFSWGHRDINLSSSVRKLRHGEGAVRRKALGRWKGAALPSPSAFLAGYLGPGRGAGPAAVIYFCERVIPCEMMATYTGYLHAYSELWSGGSEATLL